MKLYVEEPLSRAVQALVASDLSVVVSELASVEFHAAVARRKRDGTLREQSAARVIARFRREWDGRIRVAVSKEVVAHAAELALVHPLRSLDAIQLASAIAVTTQAPETMWFGSGDSRLVAAAQAEGLPIATVT